MYVLLWHSFDVLLKSWWEKQMFSPCLLATDSKARVAVLLNSMKRGFLKLNYSISALLLHSYIAQSRSTATWQWGLQRKSGVCKASAFLARQSSHAGAAHDCSSNLITCASWLCLPEGSQVKPSPLLTSSVRNQTGICRPSPDYGWVPLLKLLWVKTAIFPRFKEKYIL